MALKVGQTAYATRKAITTGIRKVTVARIDSKGWLWFRGESWGGREGRDVFATVEDAQEKAQEMARRAIKALDKKRVRLEEIARDGVRVNS